jgi:hypothetical protein
MHAPEQIVTSSIITTTTAATTTAAQRGRRISVAISVKRRIPTRRTILSSTMTTTAEMRLIHTINHTIVHTMRLVSTAIVTVTVPEVIIFSDSIAQIIVGVACQDYSASQVR